MFNASEGKSFRPQRKTWQLQEAKAKFSELINSLDKNNVQAITKNGVEVAYVISKSKFQELVEPRETLIDFFMKAPCSDLDLDLERDRSSFRENQL